MDRREFLISTGGVAAALGASVPAAVAGTRETQVADAGFARSQRRTLSMAIAWADLGRGPSDSAYRFAQRLGVISGGALSIAAAQQGAAADLSFGPPHEAGLQHPAFGYLAGLPSARALPAYDLAAWMRVGGGQMLIDDLAREAGRVALLVGHLGAAPALWSRRPIAGLADLRGLKIASHGLAADVARGLGAEPVAVAADDVVAALRDGRIDAAEAGGALTAMALGLAEAAPYALQGGFSPHGETVVLSMPVAIWDGLSRLEQVTLATAAMEEFHTSVAEARGHQAMSQRVLTQRGVRFSTVPDDIREAASRIAEAQIAHVAGLDEFARRIDHSYMAFRAELQGAIAGV